MSIDFSLTTYILASVIIILIGWLTYIHIKLGRLLRGKDARSLEESIIHAHNELQDFREFEKECLSYFTDIEKRMNRSVQAVETVRFNPFKGSGLGGNQSFSTALVNERGDGVIISTLNSRDRVSIFSKPVIKFQSEYELTEEEQQVINGAKEKLGKK